MVVLKENEIGKMLMTKFQGGNCAYVQKVTIENCNRIIETMVEEYKRTGDNQAWTNRKLARHSGVSVFGLLHLVFILAYLEKPVIHFYGIAYKNKRDKIKICKKVRLRKDFLKSLKKEGKK